MDQDDDLDDLATELNDSIDIPIAGQYHHLLFI